MIKLKWLPVLLLFFAMTARAQQKEEQITVDGLKREFVTYFPAGWDKEQSLPLIIALHGNLGTDKEMFRLANFRPSADKEHFIVVCPQGIDRSWNDGRETKAQKKNVDDVKFIDHLITYLINTYHVDATRIYVTGMSNGGFMSSRLGCQLSNRIAAIAVVAASLDSDQGYQPVKAMPVMYIQGTKDPLVPYIGGVVKGGAAGALYSHEQTLRKWADIAGYTGKPVITNLPTVVNDGTSVTKEDYTNPNNGIKVIGYTVINAGHVWPGGGQYLPRLIIGSETKNMNACEVIWAFFKDVTLKN